MYFCPFFILPFYLSFISLISSFLPYSFLLFLFTFSFFLPSIFYPCPQTKNYSLSFFQFYSAKIFLFSLFDFFYFIFFYIYPVFPQFPFYQPNYMSFSPIFPCLAIFSSPSIFSRLPTFFICHFMVLLLLFHSCLCIVCCFILFLPVLYRVFPLLYFLSLSFFYLYLHQFFIFFVDSNFILHHFFSSIF